MNEHAEHAPTSDWARCFGSSDRARRHSLRVAGMTIAWGLSFSVVSQLLERGVVTGEWGWALAALPTAIAIGLIVTFVRFLRDSDELQRLLQLRALGVGFAGAMIFSGYRLFERLGAPPSDLGDIIAVLCVSYALGLIVNVRRFQ